MSKFADMMSIIRAVDPVAAFSIKSRFDALFDEVDATAARCQAEIIFKNARENASLNAEHDGQTRLPGKDDFPGTTGKEG